jgi:hypothetical protein
MTVLLTVTILLVPALGLALLTTALRLPADVPSFPCKLRPAPLEGLPAPRWPRGRARAVWTHDVLLVRQGLVRVRLRVLAVRTPEEPLRVTGRGEVRRLGAGPLAVVLRLDDGSLVEIAAPARARTQLVGPFFAAAIPGLTGGPRERRNLER